MPTTHLTLTAYNLSMVIPMQHILVSKQSTQRDLSFSYKVHTVKCVELWSSKVKMSAEQKKYAYVPL